MIEFAHIVKKFNVGTPDEATLFNDFNLHINKGEFVSVVGSNGSGKTTMLNLLCGTISVDSGEIIVGGRNITKMSEYARARYIGRVFQDPQKGGAANLTILENMALADNKNRIYSLGKAISKKRTNHYKELLVNCHMGLEDRLNVPVGSLSGGQRQALALVIANMSDIDILILDEHTAALDPKSSERIMELTNNFISRNHITTLMVTHNLRHAVSYGSRMIMMDKGQIILDKSGADKENTTIDDVLHIFNEISIECGN